MGKPLISVIGAGPGIGLAVAKRFAAKGFRPAMVCRRSEDAATFRTELEAGGNEPLVLQADLADPSALENALEEIERGIGLPDVLVYNASRGERTLPSQLDAEKLIEDFRVNAAAALVSAQWALPSMRARGRGTMLFTGGGLALDPKAEEASLSAGKSALRSLALCLAQELEPEGIHAATITICGFVQRATLLSPEFVAEVFWDLYAEPREEWRREVVLQTAKGREEKERRT